MNNLTHPDQLDPIFNEYEAFVDKGAGLKTIAFKYFGADIQKAVAYLSIDPTEESSEREDSSHMLINSKEYYQPELLH